MSVYVLSADAAIALARQDWRSPDGIEIFAPTLLRSQVLSLMLADARRTGVRPADAFVIADRACRLPRRLLGDRVLRETAWKLAVARGWEDTFAAEYIALTRLHGEALVTGDAAVTEAARGEVKTMTVEAFLAEAGA